LEYSLIDCQPMNSGFKARRGTTDVPGFECKLLVNSDEYWLTISASKTFLSSRGITKKEDYREFCQKVINERMGCGDFDYIKNKWKNNNKTCFALVTSLSHTTEQARITYGANWRNPSGWLGRVVQY